MRFALISALVAGGVAGAQAPKPLATWMHDRVASVLRVLGDNGDAGTAETELRQLVRIGAAYAPSGEGLAEAAAWLRLCEALNSGSEEPRRPAIKLFQAHPALAAEFGLSMERGDDPERALALLLELARRHADQVARHPALATALCLVYDEPRPAVATRAKDKEPDAIDPVSIFEYLVGNESRLEFQPESLPPQVLIYLVDTTATAPELAWALNDHAGDRNVGKRYFDLTYDTASFKYNQPKKISKLPYSLENIRKVGGVCEEQAYYAAHVGKAIGVPATMITGRSSSVSHAWVGFLQQRGNSLVWNVNEGHYDEYERLRGNVRDPQTGRTISDDELALTADLCGLTVERRHAAVALAEAARAVLGAGDWPPAKPDSVTGLLTSPRKAGATGALDLLAQAQDLSPCMPRVWTGVREAAEKMDHAARQHWFERLAATCGRKYPTFGYSVLTQMITGIASPEDQAAAWQWAFKQYRTRADLAGDAKIREGKLWEGAGDPSRAYDAYTEVARTFPNDGTVAVEALAAAESMLHDSGRDEAAIDMYADAFRRIARPSNASASFFAASNYYRVGARYASLLQKAGRNADAGNVRRLIDRGVAKK